MLDKPSHSPTHFAFRLPGDGYTPKPLPQPPQDFSGSALPAISRDFVRPSPTETRRPATSGGISTRSPFNFMTRTDDGFTDPFGPLTQHRQNTTFDVDPHFVQPKVLDWTTPTITPSALYQARPQTSDGVPIHTGMVSLPPAHTIAPQSYRVPVRDTRIASMSDLPTDVYPPFSGNRAYSLDSTPNYTPFVTIGPTPKKRPRRRYDEIERHYECNHPGCDKAYGTLNHLNSHVSMQGHGKKRLPSEFRELRKAWRKAKKEAAARGSGGNQGRNSISSSDSGRRDSTASVSRDFSNYSFNNNTPDTRPTTSSSSSSFVQDQYFSSNTAFQPPTRRSSVPVSHLPPGPIPMPQIHQQGFRPQDGEYLTPTQQNPFPDNSMRYGSQAGYPFQTLTAPMQSQGSGQHGFGSSNGWQVPSGWQPPPGYAQGPGYAQQGPGNGSYYPSQRDHRGSL